MFLKNRRKKFNSTFKNRSYMITNFFLPNSQNSLQNSQRLTEYTQQTKISQEEKSILDYLPNEILIYIFQFLDTVDLNNIKSVCNQFLCLYNGIITNNPTKNATLNLFKFREKLVNDYLKNLTTTRNLPAIQIPVQSFFNQVERAPRELIIGATQHYANQTRQQHIVRRIRNNWSIICLSYFLSLSCLFGSIWLTANKNNHVPLHKLGIAGIVISCFAIVLFSNALTFLDSRRATEERNLNSAQEESPLLAEQLSSINTESLTDNSRRIAGTSEVHRHEYPALQQPLSAIAIDINLAPTLVYGTLNSASQISRPR